MNHNFKVLDFFLVRTSVLPISFYQRLFNNNTMNWEQKNAQTLDKLIRLSQKDNFIREVIATASPSLIRSLTNLSNNRKKRDQTLKGFLRYLIRMTSRPTPFGLCSGVTIGEFKDKSQLKIDNVTNYRKRARPDMEWIFHLVHYLESDIQYVKHLNIYKNPVCFINGSRVKLPFKSNHAYSKKNSIQEESSSIKYSPTIANTFQLSEKPIKFMQLAEELHKKYKDVPVDSIYSFLHKLVKEEYLLTELQLPYREYSPLDYIIDKLEKIPNINHILDKLINLKTEIEYYNRLRIGEGETQYYKLIEEFQKIVQSPYQLQIDLKTCNETRITLPDKIKSDIEKAAQILINFSPKLNSRLDDYRAKFIDKYGLNRDVPLFELLDPDIGLGMPKLEIDKNIERNTHLDQMICSWQIEAIKKNELEVVLTDEKLALLQKEIHTVRSPISMELYFTLHSQSVRELEKGNYTLVLGANAGSSSAGKTLGRFMDLFDNKDVLKWREIHKMEQSHFPNSILTEISFSPKKARLGNVSFTMKKRPYEVPIGTNPSSSENHTIHLSDLLIGCTYEHFYIKSKKHGKEVIVFTDHALNPIYSPEVCRFLLEISKERCPEWIYYSSLLSSVSPFVPRLRYKNIVLSPAKWYLKPTMLEEGSNITDKDWDQNLQQWRKKWNVPRYIWLASGDNRLLLDLEHPLHIKELRRDYKKLNINNSLEIIETGELQQLPIRNETGYYLAEFVFQLINENQSKDDLHEQFFYSNVSPLPNERRVKIPGSDWLFLKLYGNSQREEEFISSHIKQLMHLSKEKAWSDFAFYMRYRDPQQHIRLRFHGDPEKLWSKGIKDIFNSSIMMQQQGLLSNLVIDTYDPEIERYGGLHLIEFTEKLFSEDSLIVSEWIEGMRLEQDKLDKDLLGIINVLDYLTNFGLSMEEQFAWLDKKFKYSMYLSEYRKMEKKILSLVWDFNNDWPKLRENTRLKNFIYKRLNRRKPFIIKYAEKINAQQEQLSNQPMDIYGSVIHLHLNRLIGIDREREVKIMVLTRHTLKKLLNIKKYLK